MRAKTLLVLTVAATALLAGCLQQNPQPGASGDGQHPDPSTLTGPDVEPQVAHQAMVDAFANAKPTDALRRIALDARASTNGTVVATFDVRTDEDTKETLMRITGLDTVFPAARGMPGFTGDIPETIRVYNLDKVTVILGGKNASVNYNPNATRSTSESIFDSSPGSGSSGPDPTSVFLDVFRDYRDFKITSANAVTFNGRAAYKMTYEHTTDAGAVTGTIVVYVDDQLPAFMDANLPPAPEGERAPIDYVRMAFTYGSDVQLEPGAELARAAALATDAKPSFGMEDEEERTRTVTFQGGARVSVATSEVDLALAANQQQNPYGGFYGGHQSRVPKDYRLALRLSEGAAEDARARVTFTDADADGKVSPGDAYTVTLKDENATFSDFEVHLFDRVTGVRVTPPAGILWSLAGVGAIALALAGARERRRAL